MKNIQRILWLGLLVSAAGCNSGVFIDDYLPEVPVVQLSETDSAARINFKSDNWDILNIYGASENVWGVVCDLEGKPDGRNLPLENGANAVIKLGYKYCDFRVEKRNGRELCIYAGENMNRSALDVEIIVGNEYEMKSIPVSLAQTSKYEVDSIVYNWKSLLYSDNTLEPDYSLVVNNSKSDQPTSWHFTPLETSFSREVSFSNKDGVNEEELYKRFLGTPLPLVVESDLAGKEYVIPPGEKWKISVYYMIEQYWIDYKLYISIPSTGRKRTFEGKLYSKGLYGFCIIPEKIE